MNDENHEKHPSGGLRTEIRTQMRQPLIRKARVWVSIDVKRLGETQSADECPVRNICHQTRRQKRHTLLLVVCKRARQAPRRAPLTLFQFLWAPRRPPSDLSCLLTTRRWQHNDCIWLLWKPRWRRRQLLSTLTLFFEGYDADVKTLLVSQRSWGSEVAIIELNVRGSILRRDEDMSLRNHVWTDTVNHLEDSYPAGTGGSFSRGKAPWVWS
jgi:hypothetical protein